MTVEGPLQVVCEHGSAYERVEYANEVMQEIRRRATDQFLAIPRGGLEVGGVLYGTFTSGSVAILAQRELPIEYLTGPSFSLSAKDQAELSALLASEPPSRPDGRPLGIIGWWHSHTRSDVSITEADLDVHQRFFRDHRTIALIMKPFKFDPAQIAIYAPNQDGCRPCCQFTLKEGAASALTVLAPVIESRPVPDSLVPVAFGAEVPIPKPRRAGMRRPALAAGIVLLCVVAGAFALFRPYREPEPVRLDVTDTSRGLVVHWNTASHAISYASWAELLIKDGTREPRAVALRADDLHSGTITYLRKSERVEVRLRVRLRGGGVEEAVAHFIGSAPPAAVTPPVVEVARDEQPLPDWNRVQAQVDRLNLEVKRLQTSAPTPAIKPPAAAPAPVAERARAIPAVVPPPRRRAVPDPVLAAAPQLQLPGSMPSGPASLPVALPAAPVPKPPVPKPASGRAIWTGNLARGATLAIDTRRASMGDLTGRMPTRQCRVRVYVGELHESGLVVYTPSGQERVEPPSAANGWNLTTFRPDPRRSRDVSVIEEPSQKNGWQRLMVRSERPVSVLFIDWEEIGERAR